MSGGIDSSVSAAILKDQGLNVVGVFMKNWDTGDEVGGNLGACSSARDYEDAQDVCKRLQIPLIEAEFIKDYWNNVFMPFVDEYQNGLSTPNPDVQCNRYIKFKRFKEFVKTTLEIDTIATGHYVQTLLDTNSGELTGSLKLLRGKDESKDQSYFLAMTPGTCLQNVLFPVGAMLKSEVRVLAEQRFRGLRVLSKRESMGLCFIGKRRSFVEFINEYISLTPGNFVDMDSLGHLIQYRPTTRSEIIPF